MRQYIRCAYKMYSESCDVHNVVYIDDSIKRFCMYKESVFTASLPIQFGV